MWSRKNKNCALSWWLTQVFWPSQVAGYFSLPKFCTSQVTVWTQRSGVHCQCQRSAASRQIWTDRRNERKTGSPVHSPQRQYETDVFLHVTSCRLVEASWGFGRFAAKELFNSHHDEGSRILWNVGKLAPNYMTSHIKRHQPPWLSAASMNVFTWIHGTKITHSSMVVCGVMWTWSNFQAARLVGDSESS